MSKQQHPCIICEKNLAEHIHAGICAECYHLLSSDPQSINMLVGYYKTILIHKKIISSLHSFGNLSDFLKFVSDTVLTYFGYDRISIYIYRPQDNTLVCRYVSGLPTTDYRDRPGIVVTETSNIDTASAASNCFLSKNPIVVADRTADEEYNQYLIEKKLFASVTPRSKSFAMIPIATEEKVIGVLGVFRLDIPEYYPIGESELSTLVTLTDQMAVAIRNIIVLEEQVKSQKDFAAFITNIMEKDEEYSPGHHVRAADLSQEIAVAMGLHTDAVMDIYLAATVHDFGKVDYLRLVLRPDALSQKEKEHLQGHVMLEGKLFISASAFHDRLLPLISQHHEKWDGTGYPYRLKGENILLGARIICLADAFDAMVSDRPYRKGMHPDAAVKEVKNGSGSQFDPSIVDVFIKIYEAKKRGVTL